MFCIITYPLFLSPLYIPIRIYKKTTIPMTETVARGSTLFTANAVSHDRVTPVRRSCILKIPQLCNQRHSILFPNDAGFQPQACTL